MSRLDETFDPERDIQMFLYDDLDLYASGTRRLTLGYALAAHLKKTRSHLLQDVLHIFHCTDSDGEISP